MDGCVPVSTLGRRPSLALFRNKSGSDIRYRFASQFQSTMTTATDNL
jgi:hypothetical protein